MVRRNRNTVKGIERSWSLTGVSAVLKAYVEDTMAGHRVYLTIGEGERPPLGK